MLKPKNFKYHSTYLIAHEAEERGIKVSKIFNKGPLASGSLLSLKHRRHEEIIVGQRTSKTDCIAYWIQKNKHFAKYFFKRAGVSVAKGDIFKAREIEKIISFCHKIKYPVVVKPVSGTQGKKVYVGINSDHQLKKILQTFVNSRKKKVLVEEEFIGKEYRLFATKKRFVAATWRVPANVIGDGVNNVKQLIRIKNQDPRRGRGHEKSLVKIRIDKKIKVFLKKQKKSLKYKPKKNETVFLRPNSNLSTGGDSIDVTYKIHPEVKKLAVKVIKAIPGLAYGGIDFLTKDITKKPTKKNYIIIEVNDSPMISMHHKPFIGKERPVAKAIIDQLFPETKSKKKKT